MIYPAPLKKGDTVALLAPSGPCDPARLEPSVNALSSYGLRVRVMDSCRGDHGYLAAEDSVRAADVNHAFANREIRGVFAIRGGYGAQRLLPMLDYGMIRRNPKVFAGYSDITALHTVFNQICGFVTYHAPMPSTELCRDDIDPFTLRSLERFIFTPPERSKPVKNMANPNGLLIKTIVPGYAEGRLTGGNLTLLASSLGTPFEINASDSLLFLEETQEEAYRIDRLLLQLKLAGVFKDCRGILLGYFNIKNKESLQTALMDLLADEGKPVLSGIACGHDLPSLTLPLGVRAYMDAGRKRWGIF